MGMSRFQPSPNLKAGCNSTSKMSAPQWFLVSTLTQPQGRVQPPHRIFKRSIAMVSTLTQPQGRVQLLCLKRGSICFMFQPSPNLKAGCNDSPEVMGSSLHVSTLTQPQGRVQRSDVTSAMILDRCFNPHPTSRPGATLLLEKLLLYLLGFNPHPTSRPGATWKKQANQQPQQSFNPHPTSRPGATPLPQRTLKSSAMFQPSPNLKAGCNRLPQGAKIPAPIGFQPSPNLKAGCNSYVSLLD